MNKFFTYVPAVKFVGPLGRAKKQLVHLLLWIMILLMKKAIEVGNKERDRSE